MSKIFSRFMKDESGATAIEYGLIAALMAVILVALFPTLNTALTGAFNGIATNMAVN